MIYLLFLLVFIFLSFMIVFLYKYFLDILKHLKININKTIACLTLIISIVLLFGSMILIFISNVWSILSLFVLHLSFTSCIVYLLSLFFKKYKVWNRIYILLPLLFSLLLIGYGYFNMLNVIPTTYEVHNSKLNNNYKIVLISDLHYGVSLNNKQLQKYCNEISELNPDFVVLAGDIVDERTTKEQMQDAVRILGSIKTNYGIFYVYGNHDKNTYSKNPKYKTYELISELDKNHIIILEEFIHDINEDVVLIGRGFDNRISLERIMERVDTNRFILAIDHVPQEYDKYLEHGIDLLLSGHTHAGQIYPVGLIERIFKTSDQIYGIEEYNNLTAVVTSGIAGWAMPIRTEKHSEYVIINLSK